MSPKLKPDLDLKSDKLEIEIGLELGAGMGRGNREEIELETWNATPFMSRLCRKD
jgi:hypothetical protein